MPTLFNHRSLKVATPLTAAMVAEPPRVEPAGLVLNVSVTGEVAVVTLSKLSRMDTCTAGVMLAPAAALEGCVVKRSLAGAAGETLKPLLVAPVSPVAEASRV